MSGKSALTKRLTRSVKNSGKPVLVYDPTALKPGPSVNGWTADYVFTDFSAFSRAFWASRGCLVVIDEAPTACDEDAAGVRQIMMRGRHVDHVVTLIAQRSPRVDKTAREQCSELFCFRVSRSDARDLADEWAADELAEAHRLPQLHYLHVRKGHAACRGVIQF